MPVPQQPCRSRSRGPLYAALALGLAAPLLACGDSSGSDSEAASTAATSGATTGVAAASSGDAGEAGTTAGPESPTSEPVTSTDPDPGTTTGVTGTTEATTTSTTTTTTDPTATTTPETTDPTGNEDTNGRETTGGDTGDEPGGVGTGIPATVSGYPVWVHFTNPPAYAGNDRTILDETVRLINDTPAGATIKAAIHSLTVNEVQDALVAAKARGVVLRVVEDGSDQFDEDASPLELHAALGGDHRWCGDGKKGGNYGCNTSDPSGIMHSKLYIFSQTKDPTGVLRDNVSWFGSANMTHATGAKTFNNTITIYGDAALFGQFNAYFDALWSQKHYANNDFYDAMAGRGYFVTETARVYASPEADTDLVSNRLNDIVADGACEVRVAQAMIFDSRLKLVDLLVKLKQGGCAVYVVGSNVQPEALSRLKKGGIPVHKNITHDKTIIVNAKFAESPANRLLVFTGSHNWTQSANARNDELFVRVESSEVYNAFFTHFNDAYNTGAPL